MARIWVFCEIRKLVATGRRSLARPDLCDERKAGPDTRRGGKEFTMRRNHSIATCGAVLLLLPMMSLAQAAPEASPASGQPSFAIPAEHRATKEQLTKLFDEMRIREQMQTTRKIIPTMVETRVKEQMQVMREQMAPGAKLTPSQRADLDKLMHKYMEKAINIYPVDEMIGDLTGIYQEYLSREDVDAMIAFYNSPAGQHLLDAQPKITRELMPVVMQRATERTKLLTAEMMKDIAALKESSGKTQPANK